MNTNSKLERLFYPLVVGLMFGCIVLSLVEWLRLLVPTWNGAYLVVACVLAALEASYSYRLLRTVLYVDRPRFRAIELAMLFVLLKIGRYVGHSWASILADMRTWPHQPLNIIDPGTLTAFGTVLLAWIASTLTMRDLEQIGEPAESGLDYVSPVERLSRRFFVGGVALMSIIGLTHLIRVGMTQFLSLSRPSVKGPVLNVLAYFLLGLVLMGRIHFIRLRKAWREQRVRIAEKLPNRWALHSLILVGLAAFLAFLLPTGYTLDLLEIAGRGIVILTNVVALVVALMMLPLSWLAWLLAKLFGEEAPSPESGLPEFELSQGATGTSGPGWLEILRSLAFWAVMLGIIVYVARSYLRDHPEIARLFATFRPIRALRRWLVALWRRLSGLAEAVGERMPRRLSLRRSRRKEGPAGWRFFRLRALSYRERTLYYFLSVLRRAGRQGFPRRCAQTPYEYEDILDPHLPEAEQEMSGLTQAFVEARYSRQTFDQERDRRVRADWKRVRAALRALKRK